MKIINGKQISDLEYWLNYEPIRKGFFLSTDNNLCTADFWDTDYISSSQMSKSIRLPIEYTPIKFLPVVGGTWDQDVVTKKQSGLNRLLTWLIGFVKSAKKKLLNLK